MLAATKGRMINMNRRRHFGLLMILAVAAATPAFGQATGPAVGPTAIPDFSRLWAHPFYPGFRCWARVR
jgi:hypothetical protein